MKQQRGKGWLSTLLRFISLFILLGIVFNIPGLGDEVALAQGGKQYPPNWSPIIYPSQGQTQQQQEMDKFQCYSWAKETSGFDPMAPIQATAPPPPAQAPVGGVAKGGAGGAVVGLAAGSLAGEAGKGAAIGAAAGGLIGGMRRREQVQRQVVAQEQWADQQEAAYTQKRNTYNRAFTACMEGRGYTVQ